MAQQKKVEQQDIRCFFLTQFLKTQRVLESLTKKSFEKKKRKNYRKPLEMIMRVFRCNLKQSNAQLVDQQALRRTTYNDEELASFSSAEI